MYRPNFCLDCGDRIHRKRWYVWTSRRFCQKCATRLRRATVLIPFAAIIALTVGAWLLGNAGRPDPPPLILERAAPSSASLTANIVSPAEPFVDVESKLPSASPSSNTGNKFTESLTDPHETVSICGARTKKGTPCSRRVRGVGRCWQHRGKSAMLPKGKLIVNSG